jgi:hypothetical protein
MIDADVDVVDVVRRRGDDDDDAADVADRRAADCNARAQTFLVVSNSFNNMHPCSCISFSSSMIAEIRSSYGSIDVLLLLREKKV